MTASRQTSKIKQEMLKQNYRLSDLTDGTTGDNSIFTTLTSVVLVGSSSFNTSLHKTEPTLELIWTEHKTKVLPVQCYSTSTTVAAFLDSFTLSIFVLLQISQIYDKEMF